MKYLNASFSVNMPGKMREGTCERCVFGRGVHEKNCLYKDSKEAQEEINRITNQRLDAIAVELCGGIYLKEKV